MPTYEYKCRKTGHVFEQYQQMTETKLTRCPTHRDARVDRLLGTGSPPIFVGPGFYCNDRPDRAFEQKFERDAKAAEKRKKNG